MMNLERDKFLTEAIGECWHIFKEAPVDKRHYTFHICYKCLYELPRYAYCTRNAFSTWDGFGKLWEWAQKQDWWEDLCQTFYGWSTGHYDLLLLIKPDRFANAIHNYLKEQ